MTTHEILRRGWTWGEGIEAKYRHYLGNVLAANMDRLFLGLEPEEALTLDEWFKEQTRRTIDETDTRTD